MQLTRHISTAAWSTADKVLYFSMVVIYFIPQKVIGEEHWGLFTISQALVTVMYLLSDGFAMQIMVNFGVVEQYRRQATSVAAMLSILFVALATGGVFFGREFIADWTDKPGLIPVLTVFPFVALGFLVRNFTLKVAQLHIDTRGTFIIDAAWVGSTALLLLHGWRTGWLADAVDMMYVSAASAFLSSIVGIIFYRNSIRFARKFDRGLLRRMIRFGIGQFGSALTMALQAQGDVLILGTLASSALVGNYDVAKKFFRGFEGIRDAGALFIYPAVARLSAQKREQELAVLIEKMIAFMTIVMVPIVLVIWLAPIDYLFAAIFKNSYQDASGLFRILSLAALAIPLSMNSYVLLGMSQVRRLFTVSFLSVALFFAVALILVPRIGVAGQAVAVVVSFWTLGILSLLAMRNIISITPAGIISRWRDPLEFGRMVLERVRRRKKSGE